MSRKRGFDDMENDTSLQWFAKATGSDIVEGVRGKILTDLAEKVDQESEKQFTWVGGYAETDPSGPKGTELIDIVALT